MRNFNFRIFRSPEGGDSAGTVTADAESQSSEMDGASQSSNGSQSDRQDSRPSAQASAPVNKGKALAEVLEKTKDKKYTPSDEELDLLEEHWEGKLNPEEGDGHNPEADPLDESRKPQDNAKPKPKSAGVDALTTELQKELGAKSIEEIIPKLRDLKKLTGSRDAQAAARLERELSEERKAGQSERALWDDVKKGEPRAIEYLERQLAQARARHNLPAGKPQAGSQGQPNGTKPFIIDASEFTFPEEAEAINTALDSKFSEMRGLIESQAEIIRDLKSKDDRREQEHILTAAQTAQFEETMAVTDLIPELKGIKGLRDKVKDWISDPDLDIPELKVLGDLMDIANKNKTNLRIAWDSLEASRLREQLKRAKDDGAREVYRHQPNQSLSDLQGRGANNNYKTYTDTQLRAMESDHTLIPDEWFDKTGNLDERKMPERARKLLLATEERA